MQLQRAPLRVRGAWWWLAVIIANHARGSIAVRPEVLGVEGAHGRLGGEAAPLGLAEQAARDAFDKQVG